MNKSVSLDQAFLDKVQEMIEKNISDSSFGVKELALEVGISRAQLYRKLHSSIGKSPNQLIKEIRLKEAFDLLQRKVGTVSEIACQMGYVLHRSKSFFPG